MARNAAALGVTKWGRDGQINRADPPDALRQSGWHHEYSDFGGIAGPERLYYNQLLAELTGLIVELQTGGLPLAWSDQVDYIHDDETSAFVMGEDGQIHVSLAPSGPALGNATSPTLEGQTLWRVY